MRVGPEMRHRFHSCGESSAQCGVIIVSLSPYYALTTCTADPRTMILKTKNATHCIKRDDRSFEMDSPVSSLMVDPAMACSGYSSCCVCVFMCVLTKQ